MKTALTFLVIVIAVLACGCTAASSSVPAAPVQAIPNLTGTWSGPMYGYDEGTGFTDYHNEPISMVVTGQQERIFAGHFSFLFNGTPYTIPFAGVIGRDGKTLTITEKDNGYTSGVMIAENEIELTYLHDKKPYSASIDTLKRV